jgi:hypothetical protein
MIQLTLVTVAYIKVIASLIKREIEWLEHWMGPDSPSDY